mmetsp:Transcript_95493/g.309418  ORF Transcript_95493/g.309418 Transcript_95493/m.309418 type:complete len:285 (+) Transcript_95493:68-922(+)|eukprot:CAMPEP_0203907862 /NCGR_PEP_ID=MMETSP0359-20131031/49316_1 /ASSEMBLY_ACC=CAM_ASM_000338 /TAXON_ID=268821 /ORGANISM="Scrippsiella Hangoei, Strain SHTV-5" /LENGTH=284 /DNA_ID=CAMNT_0050832743 /DNA_START=36 /DNA_END=890 /DNA_ORIENTATION=+
MAQPESKAALLSQIKAAWANVQAKNPLVMCITNRVTPQRVADMLLAAGASPCMIDNADEVPGFGAISSAIYVNMGLHAAQMPANAACCAMFAGKTKEERAKLPALIVDPVGYGATEFRNKAILEFCDAARPDAIKGNAAEVAALAGVSLGGRGVDAGDAQASEAVGPAKALALKYNCLVGVSGEFDIVTDGVRVAYAKGGSVLLTKVTGIGCALGAVVAAGIAANRDDPFAGALAAHAAFKLAGTRAVARSAGPGSLSIALPDELYAIATDPALIDGADVEQVE